MTGHLSQNTIDLLAKNKLRGKEYVEALLHVNTCMECQQRLAIPSKEEIMNSLFDEEEDPPDDKNESKEPEERNLFTILIEKIKSFFNVNYSIMLLTE